MIDERDVGEMLKRRATAISDTPGDPSEAVRGARRRMVRTGLIGFTVIACLAVTAVAGVRAVQRPVTPADTQTPNPTRAAVPSTLGRSSSVVVDIRSGDVRPLPESIASLGAFHLRVSPSGSRVTFVGGDVVDRGIYVADIDGTDVRRLTAADATDPSWSPDETKVTFVAGGRVYVADIASGRTSPLTDDLGEVWAPTFSPDGDAVIFTTPSDVPDWQWLKLWSVPVDGGEVTLFMDHAAFGTFSPDGTRIAFVRVALPGDGHVWVNEGLRVANVDGSDCLRFPGGVSDRRCDSGGGGEGLFGFVPPPNWGGFLRPDWSPDGTHVAWAGGRDFRDTKIVDLSAGEESVVIRGTHPSWLDGRTLILER